MRILFLTETMPVPLDSGGRIKTFHTLDVLARRHDIDCHAFIRDAGQRQHATALERQCRRLTLHLRARSASREAAYALRALMTARPYTLVRHLDRVARRAITDRAHDERFDLVYCDHLSMVAYGHGLGIPVLYDAHNVEWELLRRHAATMPWPARAVVRLEAHRVRGVEVRACRESSMVLAVSEVDAASLGDLVSSARIRVVPIAVNARSVLPASSPPPAPHVLFVGGLHWPPNATGLEWLLAEVWPHVRLAMPAARLFCVGRATPAQRSRLEASPGVSAIGHVDDIEPWFRQARVMAVPLRSGSGMRVKVLDAFARGLPVVATHVGCEGIDALVGRHLLAADQSRQFAAHLVTVLRDDALASSLASEARMLVLERYDIDAVAPLLLDAIETAGGAPNLRQAD